jgi:hypothetical protein
MSTIRKFPQKEAQLSLLKELSKQPLPSSLQKHSCIFYQKKSAKGTLLDGMVSNSALSGNQADLRAHIVHIFESAAKTMNPLHKANVGEAVAHIEATIASQRNSLQGDD